MSKYIRYDAYKNNEILYKFETDDENEAYVWSGAGGWCVIKEEEYAQMMRDCITRKNEEINMLTKNLERFIESYE